MFKSRSHNLGKKILYKIVKYLIVCVIGYITWTVVVGKQNGSHGEQLYHQGKEIYDEQKKSTASHFEMTDDSSYIYVREKER